MMRNNLGGIELDPSTADASPRRISVGRISVGRISRSGLLLATTLLLLLAPLRELTLQGLPIFTNIAPTTAILAVLIGKAIWFCAYLLLLVKRLHDLDKPAWAIFAAHPVLLLIEPGSPTENRFGNVPKRLGTIRPTWCLLLTFAIHISIGYVLLHSDAFANAEEYRTYLLGLSALTAWLWVPAAWLTELYLTFAPDSELLVSPVSFAVAMIAYSLITSCILYKAIVWASSRYFQPSLRTSR